MFLPSLRRRLRRRLKRRLPLASRILNSEQPESLDSEQSESLDSKQSESSDLTDVIPAQINPIDHHWLQGYSSMRKFHSMKRDKMETKSVPRGMSIRQYGKNVFLDWAAPIKRTANAMGAPAAPPAVRNIGTALGLATEILKRSRRYGQGKTKKKKKNKKTFINTLKKAYKNRKTKKCKSKKCHKKSRRK